MCVCVCVCVSVRALARVCVFLCVCVFSILLEIAMNNYSISYGRSFNGPVTFIVKTFLLTSKARKNKSRRDSQTSSAGNWKGKKRPFSI